MAETVNGQIVKPEQGAMNVGALLEQNKAQLAAALPKHIRPDRLIRIVMTELKNTPELLKCSVPSLLGAIMRAAQYGLEIGGPLADAWLIPYKGQVQLQISTRGLLRLARQSGDVKHAWAYVVREGDFFEWGLGDAPFIKHTPALDDSKPMTHAYAVIKLANGEQHIEIMTAKAINGIRERSPSKNSPAWLSYEDQMWQKVVCKRALRKVPTSSEDLRTAIALDDMADTGAAQPIPLALASVQLQPPPEPSPRMREPGEDDGVGEPWGISGAEAV